MTKKEVLKIEIEGLRQVSVLFIAFNLISILYVLFNLRELDKIQLILGGCFILILLLSLTLTLRRFFKKVNELKNMRD